MTGNVGGWIGSEDCLYLNVWSPAWSSEQLKEKNVPVMMWIHGGGNTIGTANDYLQFKPVDGKVIKMQQVVVAAHLQGQGIGRALVHFSEEHVRSLGYTEVTLHAREVVMSFYEALGYRQEGDVFMEVSLPHFKHRKVL